MTWAPVHAHWPVENRVSRFDDVDLTYNSATGLAQNVTLYAQDNMAIKRLTLTAGLRCERLNGSLPEQSSPASRFFPTLVRTFAEKPNVVNWTTTGPRISAAYDLRATAARP